MGRRL